MTKGFHMHCFHGCCFVVLHTVGPFWYSFTSQLFDVLVIKENVFRFTKFTYCLSNTWWKGCSLSWDGMRQKLFKLEESTSQWYLARHAFWNGASLHDVNIDSCSHENSLGSRVVQYGKYVEWRNMEIFHEINAEASQMGHFVMVSLSRVDKQRNEPGRWKSRIVAIFLLFLTLLHVLT